MNVIQQNHPGRNGVDVGEVFAAINKLYIVSGLYEGKSQNAGTSGHLLELRVDIDSENPNSPVMKRLSGDIFELNQISVPGTPPNQWRIYKESWIVDKPIVTPRLDGVSITGDVRYWNSIHPTTKLTVEITANDASQPTYADVTLSPQQGAPTKFSCKRISKLFRSLNLEIDVCSSVNKPPLIPSYSIDAHSNRPGDVQIRTLTIEEAYKEAGVDVKINTDHTVVNDNAPTLDAWDDAELHDAMSTHFSKFKTEWPSWNMWGFLAGTYVKPSVGGIMFDAAASVGGAGKGTERQGFAVFRNHPWFTKLPVGKPQNEEEAEALRTYLYTWVHEAGHAFNLLHSWNKNRPDSLSWMNYDWKYDTRNGDRSFWGNFRFRFDDEELLHIRHGNRPSVIMGADPWSSGGHMESPPGAQYLLAAPTAMANLEGFAPMELLVRSKGYYEFMEPLRIELRLRNLMPGIPMTIYPNLNPEYGGTVIHIRRPDGRIVEFEPIACKIEESKNKLQRLQPNTDVQGLDRYSESIDITYGAFGFYFDQPGEYLVRALYLGSGDMVIPSEIHRLRVGRPMNVETDRFAQEYFRDDVGLSLYFGGSRSPFLKKGHDTLMDATQRFSDTEMGASIAQNIAKGLAKSFHRIDETGTVKQEQSPEFKDALALTESAKKILSESKNESANLSLHNLAIQRSNCYLALGDSSSAKDELNRMHDILANRGVNAPVLSKIQKQSDEIK